MNTRQSSFKTFTAQQFLILVILFASMLVCSNFVYGMSLDFFLFYLSISIHLIPSFTITTTFFQHHSYSYHRSETKEREKESNHFTISGILRAKQTCLEYKKMLSFFLFHTHLFFSSFLLIAIQYTSTTEGK